MASRAERKLLKQIEELEVALAAARERAAKPKGYSGRLPEPTVEEIRARYAQGEPVAEIAAALGVSVATVSNRTAGLKRRRPRLTDEDKAQIDLAYASGRTTAEVAEVVGWPHSAVRAYIYRVGRGRGRAHGPETRKKTLRILEEGGDLLAAALGGGVSPPTVRAWAREAGVPYRRKEHATVTEDEIGIMLDLREQGYSLTEIGKRVNRGAPLVQRVLDAYDPDRPRRVEGIRFQARNPRARNPRPKKARGPDKAALRRIMRL